MLQQALKLAERGLPVFPCRSGEKRPMTSSGFKDATLDSSIITQWWTEEPKANVAIPTGQACGYVVIDIDEDSNKGKHGEKDLAALVGANAPLPPTLEVSTPRGGRHLYFTAPADMKITCSAGKLGEAIDVRGDGGYVLVPPSCTTVGGYSYINKMKPAAPPEWLLKLLAPREKATASSHDRSRGLSCRHRSEADESELLSALECVSPDGYDTWVRVGMALKGWNPNRGLAVWDQWSQRSGKYNADTMDMKWKSFDPGHANGITVGTVFELAKQQGWCRKNPQSSRQPKQTGRTKTSSQARVRREAKSWPDPPNNAAYHGLAGDLVRIIEPHTEADPVAILMQFLTFMGNVVGRGPHFKVEADRHCVNEFCLLVGETAKGRKGTSLGHVRHLYSQVDHIWSERRAVSGLSSGEGLVWAVRDPIERKNKAGETETVDEGVEDKRLLVVEAEFASALQVIERRGNTLSACIRNLWDHGTVRCLTKNDPATTTDAHVSVVGHITKDELLRYLTSTELGNGFANRYIYVCVRRSKCLPFGGNLDPSELEESLERLGKAVEFSREVGEMGLDADAREMWKAIYPTLSDGKQGLLGCVLSRSEAHVRRLACIYALLDRSVTVTAVHLRAALALWEYAEQSAAWIFGNCVGDPAADTILRNLELCPDGLSRTEISALFGRHKKAEDISRALGVLEHGGFASCEMMKQENSIRPVEIWRRTE